MMHELAWLGGLLGGVVVLAAFVNGFARQHRRRLRRLVLLFAVCALATSAAFAIKDVDVEWAHGFSIVGDLFAALTIANGAGMLLFLIALPAISIRLPMIAGDLVVGVAYIVATIVVLSRHGLDPTSAVATGAVVSAVLVISLQATLGNILGGVALQLDGSIHEGDRIRLADGSSGRIVSIRWRHTVVNTGSSMIVVPNAVLLATNITVVGLRNERPLAQPASIAFGIGLDVSPMHVVSVVNEAIAGSPIENVALTPVPACTCDDLLGGVGFATYSLRYFVIDPDRASETASRMRGRIFTALRRAKISFARTRDHSSEGERLAQQLAALHTVHLFRGLEDHELALLAEGMMKLPFAPGETILRQGAAAHSLFVLVAGTAEVRAHFDPDAAGPRPEQTEVFATITAPDFFGEMGLLTGEPRRADVIAKTEVECFRLPLETFERVLRGRPDIVGELSARLASRKLGLAQAHAHLDELAREAEHASERERITAGIREFFGL